MSTKAPRARCGEDSHGPAAPLCQDAMGGRTLHHPTLRNDSYPSWPRHWSLTASAGPGIEGNGISLHLPAFHPVRCMPTVRVHGRQWNGSQDCLKCLTGGPSLLRPARLNTPSPAMVHWVLTPVKVRTGMVHLCKHGKAARPRG